MLKLRQTHPLDREIMKMALGELNAQIEAYFVFKDGDPLSVEIPGSLAPRRRLSSMPRARKESILAALNDKAYPIAMTLLSSTKEQKPSVWYNHTKAKKAIADFCREHGLSASDWRWWVNQSVFHNFCVALYCGDFSVRWPVVSQFEF